MEPVRDVPWQEHEKVYLLAEIIKAAPVSSNMLYGIIRDSQIQPRWTEIALPQGRSLRSCQSAFNEIVTTYSTPDFRQQRPQLPTPMIYPGQEIPKKRPHQPESGTPIGRLLQPRPPHSFPGEYVAGPPYAISQVGEPANKKKRGRPTKAEAQARADAAMARGEVYPPPRKAKSSLTGPETASGQSPPGQAPSGQLPQGHGTPGSSSLGQAPLGQSAFGPTPGQTPGQAAPGSALTGPTPIAAITSTAATTPPHPPSQPQGGGSESTSSKKKRSKPTPLELEKAPRDPSETASPSVVGSATGDTSRTQAYSSYTPISAPLPSANEPRDRELRTEERVEESQPRTTTPRSFKDTVGI